MKTAVSNTRTASAKRGSGPLDAHSIVRNADSAGIDATVIASGFAEGLAFIFANQIENDGPLLVKPKEVKDQIARLQRGFLGARAKLEASFVAASEKNPKTAELIEAQLSFLRDGGDLQTFMLELVTNRKASANFAVETAIDFHCKHFGRGNSIQQRFVHDFRELQKHLIMAMDGREVKSLSSLASPCIVVAENPSIEDIITADTKNILGWIVGSSTSGSHVRILLRDSEVPVVSASLDGIQQGDPLLINGLGESISIRPVEQEIIEFRELRSAISGNNAEVPLSEHAPVTKDGTEVAMLGTLNHPKNANAIKSMRLKGIGLFRSECMFMGRAKEAWPDEDKQTEIVVKILKTVSPDRVTIRTADLGADKWEAGFGEIPGGDGSKLGVRGIRLCLADPEFFRPHLRALIRAHDEVGNAQIMFPMINDLSEFRLAKDILLEEAADLFKNNKITKIPNLKVGAMIETAAAAVDVSKILLDADFISIGSSDLIQYSLAADRDVAAVAHSYLPHHPAVINLMLNVIETANNCGKPVSICGDMVNRRTYLPVLIGLGLRQLTLAPRSTAKINAKLASLSVPECEKLVRRMMLADTPDDAGDLLMEFHKRLENGEAD